MASAPIREGRLVAVRTSGSGQPKRWLCVCMLVMAFTASTLQAASYESGLELFNQGNYQEAREAWKQAAARRDQRSQYRLGNMYEAGIGVDRDMVEAHFWYSLAAMNGFEYAEPARVRIETLLSDEQFLNSQIMLSEFASVYGTETEDFESQEQEDVVADATESGLTGTSAGDPEPEQAQVSDSAAVESVEQPESSASQVQETQAAEGAAPQTATLQQDGNDQTSSATEVAAATVNTSATAPTEREPAPQPSAEPARAADALIEQPGALTDAAPEPLVRDDTERTPAPEIVSDAGRASSARVDSARSQLEPRSTDTESSEPVDQATTVDNAASRTEDGQSLDTELATTADPQQVQPSETEVATAPSPQPAQPSESGELTSPEPQSQSLQPDVIGTARPEDEPEQPVPDAGSAPGPEPVSTESVNEPVAQRSTTTAVIATLNPGATVSEQPPPQDEATPALQGSLVTANSELEQDEAGAPVERIEIEGQDTVEIIEAEANVLITEITPANDATAGDSDLRIATVVDDAELPENAIILDADQNPTTEQIESISTAEVNTPQQPEQVALQVDAESAAQPEAVTEVQRVFGSLTRNEPTNDSVSELQYRLEMLGYYFGDTTGQLDEETWKAVRVFQRDNYLLVTDAIDETLLQTILSRYAACNACPKR